MDDYAGRVLADRYRLPLPPSDEYELTETRAFDTYSGQEVLVRQVPLPEVVEAEVLDAEGLPEGFTARERGAGVGSGGRRTADARAATRRPADPAVRRAVEAAQAAARIPDHPRLDQVFDVFAEGGSLWIVSELVAARPLAALLAEQPLSPYRAAEVAADVLMALRVLHGHGWVHRNITARTVLVCDDGRVMLTGLAVGAAEEALCGYDPVPRQEGLEEGAAGGAGTEAAGPGAVPGPTTRADGDRGVPPGAGAGPAAHLGPGGGPAVPLGPGGGLAGPLGPAGGPTGPLGPGAGLDVPPGPGGLGAGRGPGGDFFTGARGDSSGSGGSGDRSSGVADGAAGPGGVPSPDVDPEAARRAAIQARAAGGLSAPGANGVSGGTGVHGPAGQAGQRPLENGADIRAARAGAIAAYRAGARAAARVQEARESGRPALPGARPPAEGDTGAARADGTPQSPYSGGPGATTPPGRIADPYGVQGAPWHGASPRPASGGASALSGAPQRPGLPSTDPRHGPPSVPAQSPAPDPTPGRQGSELPPYGTGPSLPAQATGPAATGTGAAPGHHGSEPPPYGTRPTLPAYVAGPGTGADPVHPRWNEPGAAGVRRGPGSALAAERARQVRMTVVGPVTERWAPEQAGPVHENWQLAAPVGPATDLWALGALLFRAVQGHAPYPEESTAELVQLVCAEPPAFAEECGPLRPVVESLLRQDPTERLDFEELNGWLRSLVRSAPEPDAGTHVVPVPPADPSRLPVVRRRGELVRLRRRRAGLPEVHPHGRHKRARAREEVRSPRSLGRTLLLLILLLLAGAIAYAMLFLPKQGASGAAGSPDRTGNAGEVSTAPSATGPSPSEQGGSPSASAPATEPQTGGDASAADGFTLRRDPEGFQVAVAQGWDRTPKNGSGQVVYAHGNFELILVPGRDSAAAYGSDPMTYQRDKESELQPYRDSSWATATGLRTIEVGGRTMAEGQFTWTDGQGRDLFVRNMAILLNGRYHIIQVRGPESQRDAVTRLYEQATATYRYTG
ncbi:protein kinase [Streptomyces puniciscabiei]|uniref:protein kinase n=1 Tax=Streptomyces puniciscabiei TaxID=164348 RepID=UPI0037B71B7E